MKIPYARPDVTPDDVQAVVDVLQNDWLTQGPLQERFEATVATYAGVHHAVAVSSGTAALHLLYLAMGLEPGKTIWTSPNTFVATANAAYCCGAAADFVDIDSRTYNLSPDSLSQKLKTHAKELPFLIVPVHFAGQSCAMEEISLLARRYGIAVVEDASHAIGGTYQGQPVGCCRWSDAAVLSFHAVKIITSGEGGMILTNRSDLYEKLIRLRSHGITRRPELFRQPNPGPWYYEQLELGYNYRLTDIQAALGLSQTNRIGAYVARRTEIARKYDQALADLPVIQPWRDPRGSSSWHLYVIQLATEQIKRTQREIFENLHHAGIGVNLHYIPVHLQPFYQQLGFRAGDFPEAEAYYRRAITLPLFPGLRSDELAFVIDQLRSNLLS
ncbi:MAG: UDP-4-amino-4,6-dideoxy-N-acetyl-beta-L-altrosamine transaminase [Verrucomicrobia bacterium]|nr:UDP-4-amino-4,6-dideoxy-N-acetyl-beta-L-altrosamine transaminase [Verrucomicrobiota bacterium]